MDPQQFINEIFEGYGQEYPTALSSGYSGAELRKMGAYFHAPSSGFATKATLPGGTTFVYDDNRGLFVEEVNEENEHAPHGFSREQLQELDAEFFGNGASETAKVKDRMFKWDPALGVFVTDSEQEYENEEQERFEKSYDPNDDPQRPVHPDAPRLRKRQEFTSNES